MKTKNRNLWAYFVVLTSLVSTVVLLSCATSPTGRKQLMLISESQMNSLGSQAFTELKQTVPVSKDTAADAYVQCVSKQILKVSNSSIPADQWEIKVFKDPQVNAFALPGGKIGVYQGLFKVAKNQSQLAAVIGHEIGHVISRHGNERVSESVVAQSGLSAIQVLTRSNPQSQTIMGILGLGAQYGIILPHSRSQESEADLIGLKLMAEAGFDPRESVQLWKNMQKESGAKPPEFMSTHPADETRIKNLEANMTGPVSKFNSRLPSRCSMPSSLQSVGTKLGQVNTSDGLNRVD